MSKKVEDRRSQREFFFVFIGENRSETTLSQVASEADDSERKSLCHDTLEAHRERLIAELREFGC